MVIKISYPTTGYLRRIIRRDELGETFVLRLFMRLSYKDGQLLSIWIFLCVKLLVKINEIKIKIIVIRLDELFLVLAVRSSRRIVRLVLVFIPETHNQTNYNCFPKFVQTDNAILL